MRRCDDTLKTCGRRAAAALAAVLLIAGGAAAQPKAAGPVSLQFTIPIPPAPTNTTGGMYAYDISFVDQTNQTYYLGDRSNAAVDVVNAASGTYIKRIVAHPAFAGVVLNSNGTANNNLSGPNGVATGGNCLFAGDGPSRVVSFLLPGGTQQSDINTGGSFRADEMAFDPKDRILVVANNADTPPFASLISVGPNCSLKIIAKTKFPFATNGAEQPVWDPATQLFYQTIPQVTNNPRNGQVLGITTSGNIVRQFPVTYCQPAGLALNPSKDELLLGCSTVFNTQGKPWDATKNVTATPYQVVMRASDGAILAYVPGVGSSDEVWYNSGDNTYYTGSQGSPYAPHDVTGAPLTAQGAGTLGVIDASSFSLLQLAPTFNVPNVIVNGTTTVHVAGSGHSLAANADNNWVFVPAPANNALPGCLKGCIQVFSR
jgi:hypothetical protein